MKQRTLGLLSLLATAGCDPGDVRVVDVFGRDAGEGDVLHEYVPGARVPLTVSSGTFTGDDDDLTVTLSAGTIENLETDDDDTLRFDAVLPAAASSVTLTLTDPETGALPPRTLVVRDPDRLTLEVTAPETAGITLPVVDPAAVRIVAGATVGLRTSMFADDTELMGLDCVTITPDIAEVSHRAGIGCAPTGCDVSRLASVMSVPATATGPFNVAIGVGTAATTITVVPTAITDITALTALAGGDDTDGSVFAAALAGDEPVFGAPVTWTSNGAALVDDNDTAAAGDVVRFNPRGTTTQALVATIGERSASVSVTGDDLSVTSITAACTTTPGAAMPMLLLGLALRRRRR